jgi:hypothetical protein
VDALTIDHLHRDGGRIRRQRMDGQLSRKDYGTAQNWSRYRRALAVPDHGMRVLCFNCHQVDDMRHRRRHLGEAGPA